MSTFCQRSYHRKCQRRGVGGQKSQNLVNLVCEWPLNKKLGGSKRTQFCFGMFAQKIHFYYCRVCLDELDLDRFDDHWNHTGVICQRRIPKN